MKLWQFGLAMLALTSAMTLRSSETTTEQAFAPGTVGRWKGNARIVLAWTTQTNLCVTLNIREDATVTGKIGEALLVSGRLKKNPGWLDRKLKVKTDYIIVGDLQGAIIAAEGITRSRVKIPLNFSSESLTGGLQTCGSQFGGKDQMILSAIELTLNRTCVQ